MTPVRIEAGWFVSCDRMAPQEALAAYDILPDPSRRAC